MEITVLIIGFFLMIVGIFLIKKAKSKKFKFQKSHLKVKIQNIQKLKFLTA